jgi:hypothetical protein
MEHKDDSALMPKEKNVFTETNAKIKKIKKKLEKIAQHEAKYKGKEPIPVEIQKLLSMKSHLLEKLNNYTSILEVHPPAKVANEPQESTPSTISDEPINKITQLLILGNLLYPKCLSESSKYADHIREHYGKYIQPIWDQTFNLPQKFTLTAWRKKILENLSLLLSKSASKIHGSGVTYKEAMESIEAAFNDTKMTSAVYETTKQFTVGTYNENVPFEKIAQVVTKTEVMPPQQVEKTVSYPIVSKATKTNNEDDEWIISQ